MNNFSVDTLEKQIDFILELEKLKSVTRKTKPLGAPQRYENSAEHSWQICVAAMIFAPYADAQIDLNKVIRMLLVHDVAEIDTGDTICFAKTDDFDAAEDAAIERIFGILPGFQKDYFIELCREFCANETAEAKFAHAMDRLMPVLQNLFNDGQSWRENNISKRQILNKAFKIAGGSGFLWKHIERRIDEFDL
ncbi:MAG: HD domain-containing protein [Acidobacteriota bacterium]|nr:HD domain-containing protein [Acidobacteriota bacterium]